ncbi:MAG TPA: methyltransferase domain-containing protein [Candidatus Acidoferrales bacterium]|jgi:ubiquinone/menaquinone biosynthesis C-methylase UbiE|nr:methyltransferase domain-containing protein [Candidatus Acidoferrales bacterium]
MADALQFDEKALLHLEMTYRAPEVAEQRRVLLETVAPRDGECALDIGCGPGFVTEELARAVGAAGAVHAIDTSDSAMTMTRRRCAEFPSVQVQVADATELPYPDAHFDLAVSTQVYEYVPDVPLALLELRRVLRPGGRAAIIDTDWHSIVWHSSDPARMGRILKVWDEHLAHPVLPRILGPLLRSAGFSLLQCKAIPYLDVTYKPENYSAHMTKTIRGFVRARHGITREEADAWAKEFEELAAGGAYFFCLNRFLFLVEKR